MKKLLYFQFDLLASGPKGTFFHWKWTRIACYKYNALVKVTPDAPKAIMEGKGVVYLLGSPILSRFACIVIGSRKQEHFFVLLPLLLLKRRESCSHEYTKESRLHIGHHLRSSSRISSWVVNISAYFRSTTAFIFWVWIQFLTTSQFW